MSDTDEPKAKKQKTSKKDRKSSSSSGGGGGDDEVTKKSSSKSSPPAEEGMAVSSSTKSDATLLVPTYEERCLAINILASPLATKKSTKRAHKLVRKASQAKLLRRGVKELVKGLRKGDRGLAILAGDVFPIDVMSHLPLLLEEHNVPYLFVPSKRDLGAAACTKRPTSCVLIKEWGGEDKNNIMDGKDLFDKLMEEAKEYDPNRK